MCGSLYELAQQDLIQQLQDQISWIICSRTTAFQALWFSGSTGVFLPRVKTQISFVQVGGVFEWLLENALKWFVLQDFKIESASC